MEAKLVAVAGPAEGRSFRITETLTIGRSVENGIRIEGWKTAGSALRVRKRRNLRDEFTCLGARGGTCFRIP